MRVASTGLGERELHAIIDSLEPKGDMLVLHSTTDGPAGCTGWHLQVFLEEQDMAEVVLGFLRPSVLWQMMLSLISPKKNPQEPVKL
jgi:hypothetical protein